MRLSWKWLAQFVDIGQLGGAEELSELLTSRGLEVEEITVEGLGFESIVVAQIIKKAPHPGADRLSLCEVSVGTGNPINVVCGAQNMKSGDRVALAQVGAKLPNGLEIKASQIRGVSSSGMLCSEQELGLSESSDGILILDEDARLGQPLAELLGRDDTVLTIKAAANRGDVLSHLGIAREIAAGLSLPLKWKAPSFQKVTASQSVSVSLNAQEWAPRFCGAVIEGIKIGPSPEWLVRRLASLGQRSVNNIVDLSNYVMLEIGHPTHAYDLKAIHGSQVIVREARDGETAKLLGGQSIQLCPLDLVIADQDRVLALAGVMGGADSEVKPETTSLYLECGEFHPSRVRGTSSRYQLKTDAAYRFERGVDPLGPRLAQARFIELILEVAGGQLKEVSYTCLPEFEKFAPSKIEFTEHYLCDFLGLPRTTHVLTPKKVQSYLEGLECVVSRGASNSWIVSPPSYRNDLKIKEDLAEEIARSIGYDEIPATIPTLSGVPVFGGSSSGQIEIADRVKNALRAAGLNEVINFAFTSDAWLSKFGLSTQAPVMNPLSEECRALVPSLLPGLVRNAIDNWNHHFGSDPLPVRLFELRPVFSVPTQVQASSQTDTGVVERLKISILISGPRTGSCLQSEQAQVDFYDLKGVVEGLFDQLGTKGVRIQPLGLARQPELSSGLFHPGKSAVVLLGNRQAGVMGMLHPAMAKDLKVRSAVWLVELDFEAVSQMSRKAEQVAAYRAWSTFPTMERDYSLVVKSDLEVDQLCQYALRTGKPLAKSARVFDVYKGAQVIEGMTSVSVRVIFYSEDRSLQEAEVEAASTRIIEGWKKQLGAELRG